MTFAPATLRQLADYWTQHRGVNLGIVGDARHINGGTSYHLGKSDLRSDAYSIQTPRDRAGLSEAASAIDLGKLNGSFPSLRRFSEWLANECMAGNAPDVREVIFTIDGSTVVGWSALIPGRLIPGYGDSSHLYHTHISYFRDSEFRDKVPLFRSYFEGEDDLPIIYATPGRNRVQVRAGTAYYRSPTDATPSGTISSSTAWFDEIAYPEIAGKADTSWVALDGISATTSTAVLRCGWIRVGDVTRREAIGVSSAELDKLKADLATANAKISAARTALS